jgi:hypothetical protein
MVCARFADPNSGSVMAASLWTTKREFDGNVVSIVRGGGQEHPGSVSDVRRAASAKLEPQLGQRR